MTITTELMTQATQFTSDDIALRWVGDRFNIQKKELIADHPWSKVYRLQGQQGTAWLKVVPNRERDVLEKNRRISEHFPAIAPEITKSDSELGLMMMPEFAGIPLDEMTSETQLRKLLITYAEMQAQSATNDQLLNALPWFNLHETIEAFYAFLDPDSTTPLEVGADYFLDPAEAGGYFKALSVRRHLLEALLEKLAPLPPALNHCDLHSQNAAERADGSMIIYDWDDAIVGPAGLSLHLILDGCTNIYRLLNGDPDINHEAPHLQRLFSAWANRLTLGDYATFPVLLDAVPASACAGLMRSIRLYGKFPSDDKDYREVVADIIRKRLDDLLQLCDLLTLNSRNDTIAMVNDYLQNNVPWRATYLLDQYIASHPNDIDLQRWSGSLHMSSGQWEAAIGNFLSVLSAYPDAAASHFDIGLAMLKNSQIDQAIEAFETTLKIDPNHSDAQRYLERAQDLSQRLQRATLPHLAPSIRLSNEERDANSVDSEHLDIATQMFREHGYVVVKNIFPKELVTTVSDEFFRRYDHYFEDRLYPDNLILGDKRRMVSVALEGILNSPRLYGSAVVVQLMKRLLGEDYVMGGYNAVVSLPGAKPKGLHKDYPPLFEHDRVETHITPSFAIAVLFPLIEMTEAHGVTSMRKGTHLNPEQTPWDAPEQRPLLHLGDAIIFDYRTAHDGMENRSDTVRPLMSMIFHRVWFRDALNYVHQKAVMINEQEYQRVPEALQHIFRWAQTDNSEAKTDARDFWND